MSSNQKMEALKEILIDFEDDRKEAVEILMSSLHLNADAGKDRYVRQICNAIQRLAEKVQKVFPNP